MSDESKTSAGAAPVALKNAAGEDARVLVTGVSGYIGAHVARVLLERGYRCVHPALPPTAGMAAAAALWLLSLLPAVLLSLPRTPQRR